MNSAMPQHVARYFTDVSEESTVTVIRVEEFCRAVHAAFFLMVICLASSLKMEAVLPPEAAIKKYFS
jgi:hypothetical protein